MNKISCLIISAFFTFITVFNANAQVHTAWTKQFNSKANLTDYGREIRQDRDGNIFVCGHSFVNEDQIASTTLIKYSPAGNEEWVKFTEIGVNMEDMQIDNSGNIYLTGDKWNGSDFDMLLIKMDNKGNELWRKFYHGGHWDRSFAIAVDTLGNIYQTGCRWYQPQFYNIMTIKYNADGDTLWTREFSSPGVFSDYGRRLELGPTGNIYVGGLAGENIALLCYTNNGDLLWSDLIDMGMEYNEFFAPQIIVDAYSQLYFCGTKYDPSTHSDIVLGKYLPDGTRIWNKTWNSPENDSDVVSGNSFYDEVMSYDVFGNLYITGTTIVPETYFSDNVVTLKFNPDGSFLWSHVYDGPANDYDRPYSIKVSPQGNVYVCGETVVNNNSLVPTDYLTMKLNSLGELQWVQTFNGVGNFFDKATAMTLNEREEVIVTGISAQDGEIFGGNRDIVTIKYNESATGITNNNGISTDYKLEQNYPNPFNPLTKISYTIPASENVTLRVFDVNGKEVSTLINMYQTAGSYEVDFDGSDLSSGMYFYKLQTSSFTITKKMTLLK